MVKMMKMQRECKNPLTKRKQFRYNIYGCRQKGITGTGQEKQQDFLTTWKETDKNDRKGR